MSPLVRGEAKTLQLNIGLYCNQACTHCHVESSPKRCAPEMSGVLTEPSIRLGAGFLHLNHPSFGEPKFYLALKP